VTEPSTAGTVARNSLSTFAARLAGGVLTTVAGIVIAKSLGPAGKGIYSGVLMFVNFAMIAPAGIGTALIYALTKQQRRVGDLVPSAVWLLVVWTLACWLAALIWGIIHGFGPALWAFIAAIPPSIILAWQGGLYIGIGRMGNLNVQTFGLSAALCLAIVIVLTVGHGDIRGVLAAWLVCLYGAAAVVVWHALRLGGRVRDPGMKQTLRGLVGFGAPSALNNFLGILNYRVDSVILIALLGVAPFGVYSIAVNFGELLFMLTRPITAAATRDIGVRDLAGAAAITARVIRTCTALVAVAAVVACVLGPWAIHLMYGPRFAAGATPLRILLPGIVLFATAGTFAAFFIVQLGKPVIVTVINLLMIGVQAAACFLLVPRMGMSGAALASSLTYAVGAALNTTWLCRSTGLRARDVWIVRRADLVTAQAALSGMLRDGLRWGAGFNARSAQRRAAKPGDIP
jgi:O-antigen/teichoic acid export membrane protein